MSSWRDKRTKVVVRHLPPEWNEETFRQVAGEWMDRCSWFRFVEGKDAIRKKGGNEEQWSFGNVLLSKKRRAVGSFMGYSRAYLRFRGAEDVPSFKEYFEAKAKSLLKKENGNRNLDDESRSKGYSLDVVVQYAPYQTVTHDKDAPKRNKWQSSLENDEEFQAFREGLLREDGEGKGDELNQKVQEIKSNQEVVEGKPKETALMKYVTQLHRKKAQEKVSKRDVKKKSVRQPRNENDDGKKKEESKTIVAPKVSKKKQPSQSSGTTKNNDQDGGKSGTKGKQSNATGPEILQSKKKDTKKNRREKTGLQKRQDSTGSSLISVEGRSIVKQMPKNASASSARGLKSPSKPAISILQKPKETHLVSTSTEKKNNVQDGSKEVKFKILTRKESDANVKDKSKLPLVPPGLSKASEKSAATEASKGNSHPRRDKPINNNKGKNAKDAEGEASNQGKGRQRRRGPRRQKKTDG